MIKKYILTDETKIVDGHVLHRIKALINFYDVTRGDLGGFVESEYNLSHEGKCWVYHNACVFENARVYDNAQIKGFAKIYNNAGVYNYVKVFDKAKVYGNARLFGCSEVSDHAKIFGNAILNDFAKVSEHSTVYGNAQIYGHADIYGDATVGENAQIYGHAIVRENAQIYGHAKVYDFAKVLGHARIYGNAEIYDQAKISGVYSLDCMVKIYGNAKIYNTQYIQYGTVTKDILKEKDWEFALKCLQKDIQIIDNQFTLYIPAITTRNKNILSLKSDDGLIVVKKNKSYNFCSKSYAGHYDICSLLSEKMYVVCKINLNDIIEIQSDVIYFKKFKVVDFFKIKR